MAGSSRTAVYIWTVVPILLVIAGIIICVLITFTHLHSFVLPPPYRTTISHTLAILAATSNSSQSECGNAHQNVSLISLTVGLDIGYRVLDPSQAFQQYILTGKFSQYKGNLSTSACITQYPSSTTHPPAYPHGTRGVFSCCNATGYCITLLVEPVFPPEPIRQCALAQSQKRHMDFVLRQLNCIAALYGVRATSWTSWLAAYRCAIPIHMYKYFTFIILFGSAMLTSVATLLRFVRRKVQVLFMFFKQVDTLIGALLPIVISSVPNLTNYLSTYTCLWIAILARVTFGGDDAVNTTVTHEMGAWATLLSAVMMIPLQRFDNLVRGDGISSFYQTEYGHHLKLTSWMLFFITLLIIFLRMWLRHVVFKVEKEPELKPLEEGIHNKTLEAIMSALGNEWLRLVAFAQRMKLLNRGCEGENRSIGNAHNAFTADATECAIRHDNIMLESSITQKQNVYNGIMVDIERNESIEIFKAEVRHENIRMDVARAVNLNGCRNGCCKDGELECSVRAQFAMEESKGDGEEVVQNCGENAAKAELYEGGDNMDTQIQHLKETLAISGEDGFIVNPLALFASRDLWYYAYLTPCARHTKM